MSFNRCLIFFLLMLLAINVSAQIIKDSNTGFSVNINFPQTSACVVYPNKSYDADVCPIDNYVFPTEDANMIARGVIRFEPGEMLFNMAHIKAPFTAPIHQKDGEAFIAKYLELFNVYDTGETLDSGMVLVNDQPFYRFYGDVGTDTALPHSRILFYAFSGKGYHYFISFNFDSHQEKKAFEVSDHILRTIKVPLPEYSEKGELIYQLSYEVLFSTGLFVGLFLVLHLLSYLFHRLSYKKQPISEKQRHTWQNIAEIFILRGIEQFIALAVLIVGIYETTIAFRKWEAVISFLGIYIMLYGIYILIRMIWRLISEKSLIPYAQKDLIPEAIFFPIGIPKLILLSIFTFGLYSFYWFYKNWEYVQRTTKKQIYPILKAVFYPICAYFLFKRIKIAAKESSNLNLHAGLWATILALCYLIDMVPLGNIMPQPFLVALGLIVFFLEFLILVPVQVVINQLNKQFVPTADLNQRFKPIDGVICFIGGIGLVLVMYLFYTAWIGVYR